MPAGLMVDEAIAVFPFPIQEGENMQCLKEGMVYLAKPSQSVYPV